MDRMALKEISVQWVLPGSKVTWVFLVSKVNPVSRATWALKDSRDFKVRLFQMYVWPHGHKLRTYL